MNLQEKVTAKAKELYIFVERKHPGYVEWDKSVQQDWWVMLARHVLACEIRARINECSEHLYDSTMSHIRRNELTKDLQSLEGTPDEAGDW